MPRYRPITIIRIVAVPTSSTVGHRKCRNTSITLCPW
jgi:hypothetical protein